MPSEPDLEDVMGSVSSFPNLQFYDIFSHVGMRLRVKEGIKKYMLNFFKKLVIQ